MIGTDKFGLPRNSSDLKPKADAARVEPRSNQQREAHRVVIAAQCQVWLWRPRRGDDATADPPARLLVQVMPIDASPGGLAVALDRADHERLRLQPSHTAGVVIERGGERLMLPATV